jgi:SNF family Na+-dependent transporter
VGENIVETHLPQGKLNVIRVSRKILESMKTLSQASKCLTQILFLALVLAAMSVHASVMDAAAETELDKGGTSRPVATLVRDVVFHSGLRINIKLDLTNWASQALVELARIFVVGVIFRVTGRETLAEKKHTRASIERTQYAPLDGKHPIARR